MNSIPPAKHILDLSASLLGLTVALFMLYYIVVAFANGGNVTLAFNNHGEIGIELFATVIIVSLLALQSYYAIKKIGVIN